MCRIIFEQGEFNFAENDIILILQDDCDTVLNFINKRKSPKPLMIFCLSRFFDLTKEEVYYIAYYIKKKHNLDDYKIDILDSKPHLLNMWELLFDKISISDIASVSLINKSLNFESEYLFSYFHLVRRVIDEYTSNLLTPLIKYTPYVINNISNLTTIWPLLSNNIIKSIAGFINSLKQYSKNNGFTFNRLTDKFEQNLLNFWNEFESESLENKFKYFSAYIFRLSEIYSLNNYYFISMQLVYRALDIYMQYVALKENLIRIHDRKFVYNRTEFSEKYISLSNTKKILSKHGCYIFKESQVNLIDTLSKLRNNSILAHSVYSYDKKLLLQQKKQSFDLINTLEGTNLWKNLYLKTDLSISLNNLDLFDVEPSIDTYFSKQEF